MMDSKDLDKLLEQQQKGLVACFQQIEQWEKFKSDYENLKNRLDTFSDKISYDVMVPFGQLAFMPGKLIHTNEITVLLGDNWFVERSSKQAVDIVKRRIKQCETMLNKLEEQKEQFENWIKYTEQVQGENLIEVREEYDPVKESLWREEHRKRVQAYNRQHRIQVDKQIEKMEDDKKSSLADKKILTDEELQSQLSKLEIQEEQNNEFDELTEESTDSTTESTSSEETNEDLDRKIKWKDEFDSMCNVINFTHTPVQEVQQINNEDIDVNTRNEEENKSVAKIQSPSDIYKEFAHVFEPNKPKSILKNNFIRQNKNSENKNFYDSEKSKSTGEICTVSRSTRSEECNKNSANSSNETDNKPAFSGEIQERNPKSVVQIISPQPTKRVSKFKAQRLSHK